VAVGEAAAVATAVSIHEGGKRRTRARAHTQRSHYYYCEGVTAQTIERKEMRFGPGRTVAALCLQQIKILSAGIRAAAVKRLH